MNLNTFLGLYVLTEIIAVLPPERKTKIDTLKTFPDYKVIIILSFLYINRIHPPNLLYCSVTAITTLNKGNRGLFSILIYIKKKTYDRI